MKRFSLLLCNCLLALMAVGCNEKGTTVEYTSDDESLAGVVVGTGDANSPYYKLFVLNEGKMGSGNASLDFLRFKDATYVRNSFSRMNPTVVGGLGDVGNDIAVFSNTVWMLLTGSGIVEVASALDETHITTIEIPTPRKIAFDYIEGQYYAYITSYSGAYYGGDALLGTLYKVSLSDFSIVGKLEVGYQPEGVAVCGDDIYVACSGGYNGYTIGYDNRVFVVDRYSFTVSEVMEVAPNLSGVVSDGEKNVWVLSQGDWYSTHSAVYHINTLNGDITEIDLRASTMSYDYNSGSVYVLGTEDEWVWDAKQTYSLGVIKGKQVTKATSFSTNSDAYSMTLPYGVLRNPDSGEIYICDAGDWVSPGKVWSFSSDLSTTNWSAEAGIGAGHMVLYSLY